MHTAHSQGGSSKAGTASVLAFDFDALYADLQRDKAAGNEGHTATELRERFGWSIPRCTKIIKAALKAGKCRRTEKVIETMSARLTTVTAYVFEVEAT